LETLPWPGVAGVLSAEDDLLLPSLDLFDKTRKTPQKKTFYISLAGFAVAGHTSCEDISSPQTSSFCTTSVTLYFLHLLYFASHVTPTHERPATEQPSRFSRRSFHDAVLFVRYIRHSGFAARPDPDPRGSVDPRDPPRGGDRFSRGMSLMSLCYMLYGAHASLIFPMYRFPPQLFFRRYFLSPNRLFIFFFLSFLMSSLAKASRRESGFMFCVLMGKNGVDDDGRTHGLRDFPPIPTVLSAWAVTMLRMLYPFSYFPSPILSAPPRQGHAELVYVHATQNRSPSAGLAAAGVFANIFTIRSLPM
jgi:hypothetical protein